MGSTYHLLITRAGQPVVDLDLPPGVTTLGRSQDNDVSLEGPKLSRAHAILIVSQEGECHLQDLGSRNGTFLSSRRIAKVRLQHGDVFQVGPYACEVRIHGEAAAGRASDPETLTASVVAAVHESSGGGLPLFLGKSPAAKRVLGQALRAADTDLHVLITGESGSGKGVMASIIHRSGRRAAQPFVVVNCAAIPGELIESELFGHRRGAFTGAVADQLGKFRAAHRGTLFLDEIGDLSAAAQAKILRAIENQEVEPLGEPAPVRIDVRVIAATHQDLGKAVSEGRFRLDLLHRLSTLTLEVPPLRDRKDDLVVLANWFLAQLMEEIPRAQGAAFSSQAIEALCAHDWPGNVRELRNTVAQALVAREGDVIRPEDLRFARPASIGAAAPPSGSPETDPETLAGADARHIARALERHGWNLTRTAKSLGIARSTLRGQIERLGLRPPGKA